MDNFEAVSIALYDTEDKKLVAVFRTKILASGYIFKEGRSKGLTYKLNNKLKFKAFDRICTLRPATIQQQELLGDEGYVILDNRFKQK